MHEGRRHRLPAQEQPGPHRAGDRGRACPGASPHREAEAEEALRRSEANLRAIFDNNLQGFLLIDPDGTIKALNSTAAEWSVRLLGRTLREGAQVADFLPEAHDAFRAALGGEVRHVERCFSDTDGSEIWFETTHAPVVDERGAVIGVCLNARDVSTRKQAERALRESEARYRDLFDNASDLVCATDPAGALPLRESGLAGRHRLLRRRPPPAPVPRRGPSRQPRALRRGGRAGTRGRDADPRRAGPDDRARHADHGGRESQLHVRGRAAGDGAGDLPRRDRAKAGRGPAAAGASGCRRPGGWPAAWRTKSTT